MAGQSVGMVTREQSTKEILDELVEQALSALVSRDLPDRDEGGAERKTSGKERAGTDG